MRETVILFPLNHESDKDKKYIVHLGKELETS